MTKEIKNNHWFIYAGYALELEFLALFSKHNYMKEKISHNFWSGISLGQRLIREYAYARRVDIYLRGTIFIDFVNLASAYYSVTILGLCSSWQFKSR